ncbi:16727_t:CDS:2 [Dentiscutata heterogama]|uniref:16727_t:CDS:1 n=1 Tax=Dentiscutata heterogama TaxID=1316150 RepID=A0ACA9MMH4_9GLOM|nr:16727_t:CDS:2 [Dentiscutata heterogama]
MTRYSEDLHHFEHKLKNTFDDFLKKIGLYNRDDENREEGNCNKKRIIYFSPRLDFHENDKEYVILTELPGIKKEEIHVELKDGGRVFNISGEIKQDEKLEKGKAHIVERRYGRFHRSVVLSENVNPDGITANFHDGILKLIIPKQEPTKTKKVSIL